MSTVPATVDRRRRDDDGFTLIEVLVAVAIIAVVMLGLGAVFVATASGTDAQGLRQTAVRVATDGLDRVRGLGTDVVEGRTAALVGTTWPATVRPRLAGLPVATDPDTTATPTPALPLQATQTVDGLVYTQSFYVAGCQLTAVGTCQATAASGTVPMYDVVVAVGWRHSSCPASACSYLVSTLVSASTAEPLFNSTVKAAAPAVSTAAVQVLDLTDTVTGPPVAVSGGNGSVTVTTSPLPEGITLDLTTMSFTGTARAVTAGTAVTVTATDQFGLWSSAQITFTVNPLPALSAATVPVTTGLATAVDLAGVLKLAGGTAPYTWRCGTLPAGLTLDSRTGVLTALVPVAGVLTPPCTVTDARTRSAAATLTMTAVAPLTVTSPAPGAVLAVRRGAAVKGQAVATGCGVTCSWKADTLPPGVTLSAAGVFGGAPTTTGTTVTVLTVTDGPRTATASVTWSVTP